ncbi:probable leucine-rich repeat receptor-like protein kinase At1g35710 [Zingiber officinale]|uniref:probable leucine-rich repeat receptor-like protein kinase At1g35710 n=1 Tax=Zingiber officinale TaxID=94328 RepID=UPI001C4CF6B2|nr:probable leucine-rich repeat receptor-like protein kinase At1g35710 [Zingiber officinale]
MATAWRSRLRFREAWPLQYYRCYYQLPADLVLLCWLIMMAFFLVEVAGVVEGRVSSEGCLPREKDALLLYKAAIEDPSDRLSSWQEVQGDDCCAWTGVVCYNRTGSVRVAELNLQNPNEFHTGFNDFERTQIPPLVGSLHKLSYLDLSSSNLGGTIPPHLGNLTNLRHLDLSWSYLGGTIPPHLGNLTNLRHLDLSGSKFGGAIPPHLGNLTNLRYLDLSGSFNLYFPKDGHSLDWLSGLSSLIYLDMSGLNLSAVSHNWFSAVNMLPSLQQLYLYDCEISNIPLSLSFPLNLTLLTTLDLSWNNFNSSFPNWLWNLTSLSYLQLYYSNIRGMLPVEIGDLISLTHLVLPWNLISGPLPDTLWKLKHLTYLDLSYNLLGNSLPMGMMNLSSLSILCLTNCSLIGPIPSELGNLTTLNELSLESNLLSGLIPHEIGKLVNLEYLDLSINSFEGDITEFHLSNLTKLYDLSLSENHFLTIAIDHNWTPPFQLDLISLGSCKLGPRFPTWLRSQKFITVIDLHNTSIEDNLPEWFWNSLSIIQNLDLSHNQINGILPVSLESLTQLNYLNFGSNLLEGPILHLPPNLNLLDLSDNAFSGPLPPTLFTPQLNYLILSHNHINGSIPSDICNCTLGHLDLSNNQIFGEIPRLEGGFSSWIY